VDVQEPIMAYGHIMLLATAVKRAGSTDRRENFEPIYAFGLRNGPCPAGPDWHV
jgi:hypothetical protein